MNVLNQNEGFSVSDKYKVVNSGELINLFENQGYMVTNVVETKTRDSEKLGHQLHRIRMTHEKFNTLSYLGTRPELVITNAHDGSSSLKINLGFYRLICSNGLMVGESILGEKVKHIGGDIESRVIQAAESVSSKVDVGLELVNEASSIISTPDQRELIKENVLKLVLPDNTKKILGGFDPRRRGDLSQDLWTVFNRYQEAALRGGIRYVSQNESGELKRNKTRAISSIQRSNKVNGILFDTFAELVKAA